MLVCGIYSSVFVREKCWYVVVIAVFVREKCWYVLVIALCLQERNVGMWQSKLCVCKGEMLVCGSNSSVFVRETC